MTERELLHSPGGDAAVIVETAERAAAGRELDTMKVYGVTVPAGGRHEVVDLERYCFAPRRKAGLRVLYTAGSFNAYVGLHKADDDGLATIWADVEKRTITAVLNDHSDTDPAWRDHAAVLQLRHPPPWVRWLSRDGTIGSQTDFAEHIEDSLPEIVEPDGATMLELAQSFHATGKVLFKSDRRLTSGTVQLTYEETVDAKAGDRGQLTIPQTFVVALAPFEGMDAFRVNARLRYRLREGQLAIGYVLDRPDEVLRAAFAEIVEQVAKETELDVWQGQP